MVGTKIQKSWLIQQKQQLTSYPTLIKTKNNPDVDSVSNVSKQQSTNKTLRHYNSRTPLRFKNDERSTFLIADLNDCRAENVLSVS